MRETINRMSKGKIDIKYKIVSPKIPTKRRRVITILCNLFIFLVFILLLKIASFSSSNHSVTLVMVFFFLLLFVYDAISKRLLLTTQKLGLIKFLDDFLEIEFLNDNVKYRLTYNSIAKIRYKKNIPETLVWRNTRPISIISEFITYDNKIISLEIENRIYLANKDQLQFRSMEPDATFMLNEIKTKYGIEEVRAITTPNSGLVAMAGVVQNGISYL